MGIVEAFTRAKNSLVHARALQKFHRLEMQCARGAQWHFTQAESFLKSNDKDGTELHLVHGLLREAETKRFQHAQERLRSGKSFWETHDIESWAKNADRLNGQSKTKMQFGYLMAELPDTAIRPLMERVRKMQRGNFFARCES